MQVNNNDKTEMCIKLQINIISSTSYRNFGILQWVDCRHLVFRFVTQACYGD